MRGITVEDLALCEWVGGELRLPRADQRFPKRATVGCSTLTETDRRWRVSELEHEIRILGVELSRLEDRRRGHKGRSPPLEFDSHGDRMRKIRVEGCLRQNPLINRHWCENEARDGGEQLLRLLSMVTSETNPIRRGHPGPRLRSMTSVGHCQDLGPTDGNRKKGKR